MTEQATTSGVPNPERLAERLQPKLDELEQEREATRRSALRWFAFLGVATAGVAIAAAVAMAMAAGGAGAGIGVLPLVLGGVLIAISASRYQARWTDRVAGGRFVKHWTARSNTRPRSTALSSSPTMHWN